MMTKKQARFFAFFVLMLTGVFAGLFWLNSRIVVNKDDIARSLHTQKWSKKPPEKLVLETQNKTLVAQANYTFDDTLTQDIEKLFKSYNPDYGAFVAIDASTGRVLALIDHNPEDPWIQDHLALRATFPSASVFKVVTAAAAIAERKLHSGTLVSYNGRAHTLYKNHLFKESINRWTNHVTLKHAFAHSVNTVFGKLGVFNVGPVALKSYAQKFGFDRKINSDLPLQEGRAGITEDPWELAEAASGFTRTNTMSPLQGALIAAAIVNDGIMMEPFAVDSLKTDEGKTIYQAQPKISETVIDIQSATEMKELMRETVESGTSRGSFKGFFKSRFKNIDVGGKTGSLTGTDPEGKYDWFVGYASFHKNDTEVKIAIAALTISKEYWKVKSSYIARRAIESYFSKQEKQN